MNMFTRSGAAALAAALSLTLAACGGTTTTNTSSSSSAAATTTTTSAATVSTTSAPGAMMSGSGSAMMSAAPSAADAQHNAADLAFAQQMIVHHQGAIEMADLAPTRAASQQVKDLAVRIKAAQGPEIQQMQGWLTTWGAAMPSSTNASSSEDTTGMDMGGMGSQGQMTSGGVTTAMSIPGMMSDADMQQLTAASGTEFDRLFLQQMIVHHQGALEMAGTELAQGSSAAALALAQSIKTSQTAEITEMQQMLQTL
jgi:uncharacterized protein (DUF305 family)